MYADPHLSDTTRLFSTKEQRFPQISFRERHGGIAQLGERMTGSHEVSGSIPLISTKKRKVCLWHTFLFYYIEPLSVQADRAERAYFNRKG